MENPKNEPKFQKNGLIWLQIIFFLNDKIKFHAKRFRMIAQVVDAYKNHGTEQMG